MMLNRSTLGARRCERAGIRLSSWFSSSSSSYLGNDAISKGELEDEDLSAFKHGRRGNERQDSVSELMLLDRQAHQERCELWAAEEDIPGHVYEGIRKLNLGSKKRVTSAYRKVPDFYWSGAHGPSTTGARGHGLHLTSCSEKWPAFKHLLPEIAFVGHSNSGKSTLVNAMVGISPQKGPASVSDRAGWTDQLCFFQLGKKPPILTAVDLPGYGHAVATSHDMARWRAMTSSYLLNRPVLSLACILVDCTRGLCNHDRRLLRSLIRHNVPWQVVLTKCDLFSSDMVAASLCVTAADIDSLVEGASVGKRVLASVRGDDPPEAIRVIDSFGSTISSSSSSSGSGSSSIGSGPWSRLTALSSSTGAGVQAFWRDMCLVAALDSGRRLDSQVLPSSSSSSSSTRSYAEEMEMEMNMSSNMSSSSNLMDSGKEEVGRGQGEGEGQVSAPVFEHRRAAAVRAAQRSTLRTLQKTTLSKLKLKIK
jgi:ribosome biogenesis GTP-binding protein YsxC/EngB